jgi:release factor glutamine methyltransferase
VSAAPTVLEIIKKTTEFLQGRGVESPRLNAEHLIGHGLGLKRMQLYLQFERPLSEAELATIRPLVRRRGQREPLQYVVGEVDFFGVKLKVDRRALIPRPETERLVELAVARHAVPPERVLDLGTGSGAIALALARAWPAAKVTAVDLSPGALALARENAEATGTAAQVTFLESDWFARLPASEPFDLIVANPPYLSAQETAEAAPEVREFEPMLALTSGVDGRGALRTILQEAARFLAPGGQLALETGPGQHEELVRLAGEQGWVAVESVPDLAGRDRFIFAARSVPS